MRRTATLLLALTLALGQVPHAVATGEPETPQTGDLNGDGQVSAADAAVVLRAASGALSLDNDAVVAADVTGSLSVNQADATAILLRASGLLNDFSDLVGKLNGALLGEQFAERFSYLGTIITETAYRSDQVSVTSNIIRRDDSICYVMDIYLRDITSFRTAFSSGEYRGKRETVLQMAEDNEAIVAINGDFYSYRGNGPVVRNGVWYVEDVDDRMDICVLYRDGRLVTYDKGVTLEEIQAGGEAYQSWAFGAAAARRRRAGNDGVQLQQDHSHHQPARRRRLLCARALLLCARGRQAGVVFEGHDHGAAVPVLL